MQPEELRQWVDSRRAAEEREREEQRNRGIDRAWSVRSALALVAVAGRLHGWPLPEDETMRREDALMQESWVRLRSRHRGR